VVNSRIDMIKNTESADSKISQIFVRSVPEIKDVTGTVLSIQATDSSVTVQNNESGEENTYKVPAAVSIHFGSTKLNSISELNVGDIVQIRTTDNVVTTFELVDSVISIVEGKLE